MECRRCHLPLYWSGEAADGLCHACHDQDRTGRCPLCGEIERMDYFETDRFGRLICIDCSVIVDETDDYVMELTDWLWSRFRSF